MASPRRSSSTPGSPREPDRSLPGTGDGAAGALNPHRTGHARARSLRQRRGLVEGSFSRVEPAGGRSWSGKRATGSRSWHGRRWRCWHSSTAMRTGLGRPRRRRRGLARLLPRPIGVEGSGRGRARVHRQTLGHADHGGPNAGLAHLGAWQVWYQIWCELLSSRGAAGGRWGSG
jgi:hypothetical protein